MSACTADCAAFAFVVENASAERAFKLMLDSVRRRASAVKERVLFIIRANEPRLPVVIGSLPDD